MDRRTLIKNSLIGGGMASAAMVLRAATPSQPEGPFHPVNIDNDLRRLREDSPFAEGQQIKIVGTVRRSDSRAPLANVMIEIWQADHQGKYAHPSDPLPYTPDPNFQFWGRAGTDANGNYSFLSIKPGAYPADDNWMRPPHIHMRFSRRGFQELTTQLYFAGEALNDRDLLLQRVPAAERHKLIVSLGSGPIKVGSFHVELDPV